MKQVLSRVIFVAVILLAWELVSRAEIFSQLLFPSLEEIASAFVEGFLTEHLWSMAGYSMLLILKGMAVGICLSLVFSVLAIINSTCHSIFSMVVSTFDLLPGVALVPLAILWFGIGEVTIIVIVTHSIVWPMSRSVLDGFNSTPKMYIEAGKNIGLKGFDLVRLVYAPAAFSYLLSGLRTGWARAWRAAISTEMIFGTTGAGAGIGWYIYMKRTNLDTAGVFASLIVIVIIGIVIEYGLFNTIERNTVRKWGMVR